MLEVYYNVCLYFKDFEERECIVVIFSGMVFTRLPAKNYLMDTLSPFYICVGVKRGKGQ